MTAPAPSRIGQRDDAQGTTLPTPRINFPGSPNASTSTQTPSPRIGGSNTYT